MAYFDYAKWEILIVPSANMWMGYILDEKMDISCKLHTNGQGMRSHMLIAYIIYVDCVHIIVGHHSWLNGGHNFLYATNRLDF
jgi:hypothetical protein